ncbi:MAG: PD40 domain-containing protein [Chloroflexi bacterium]|nr:PD40 domain-containing protein [Chloroflexota bacterium]
MKKQFSLLLLLTLILTACGTLEVNLEPTSVEAQSAANLPTPTPAAPTLSMASTSEEIQRFMLTSATRWQTLFMDGTVYNYDRDSNVIYSMRQQAWIDQMSARFRVLSGPVEGEAAVFKASDGENILTIDLKSGATDTSQMSPGANQPQYVPPLEPGTAYPNPLWGQIGEPLAQLAFPSDFAQNQGTFKPVGMETLLDRTVIAVEWTYANAQNPSFRAWLDLQTGVILKMQNYGKEGGTLVETELTVNQIAFDVAMDSALFSAPTGAPRFADVNGAALTPLETGPAVPSGQDPLGDLYFFTLPHQAGQMPQLVRLPGSCVVGLNPCPQVETIPLPFALNFNLSPLVWSPDGKYAALSYPANGNGMPQNLYLFDPTANTWTALTQFPYIDPPFWSPDGTWIAFRTQDGQGGEDVFVVRRDGSDQRNLTASGSLPANARPYVMDGWLTENIILRSALPGKEGTVYLVRASDGAVRPLFETLLTKASFFPAPDGSALAFDEYDYVSQKHILMVTEPDGANLVDLATFSGGSLYPIVWSPDKTRVAFVYYTSFANGNPTADVYIVGRDGRGLSLVYKGVTIGRVLFSPDGNYLLVEETTSPTGGHLFVVNLSTLASHMLQAPGLSLDSDWYAPSWRK